MKCLLHQQCYTPYYNTCNLRPKGRARARGNSTAIYTCCRDYKLKFTTPGAGAVDTASHKWLQYWPAPRFQWPQFTARELRGCD